MKLIVAILLLFLLNYAVYDFSLIEKAKNFELPSLLLSQKIPEESGIVELYFCPRDNCTQAFVNLTKNSETYCAFYDLKLEEFKKINLPVIIDDDYPVEIPHVASKGRGLMHHKFCIINQSIIWTGSMNPTPTDAYRNPNNMLIIHSKTLANNYLAEYEELKSGVFGGGKKTRHPELKFNNFTIKNAFCPEDDCDSFVLKELEKAEESIYFMTFTFTSISVADLLIRKSSSIEIKGVVDNRNANHPASQFAKMNLHFPVSKHPPPATMHHKVFIIDSKTVITGSWNPTKAASTINDENILVIHNEEIAKQFLEEFEFVWE